MNTWNMRTEILVVAHRWYWVVASFLLGALFGWLISLIWSAPYRAVQDVYVGLNANRATRDLYIAEVAEEQFRNLDDYKNWQMSQLNSLAMSDEFLTETLDRLQTTDQDWQDVDLPELREMLTIAWRNTGDWHFSAQSDGPVQATQAVLVWSKVVTEKVALAVDAARNMVLVDSQLQAVSNELAALRTRQILLQETQTALDGWHTLLKLMPDDQSVQPSTRWALISQVTNAADWNLGWISLLEASPSPDSLPEIYLDWLVHVDAVIESELTALPAQIGALTSERDTLATEYAKAADESRALSATLAVQTLKSEPPQLAHLRDTGTMILSGGLLGLLVWGFIWLAQVTRRTE